MEYILPPSWVRIKLRESVNFRKGKKPQILRETYFEGSVPYMDIKALEKGIINFYADSKSGKYFNEDDVVIVWDGSRSGLILKPKEGAIGSTLGALSPIGYNSRFLYYFLLSHFETINSKARGVGIPHVDPTYFWNLLLPLPPLEEQKRIVAKLDALFIKYETIKNALERVPQLLKDFRQQLLDSYYLHLDAHVELSSACIKIQDGAHHSPKILFEENLAGTFPYITSKNIRNNYMKLDKVHFVHEEFHNSIYERCKPELGNVLLTKDGANTGNVTLNTLDRPFSLLSSVCLIKPKKELLNSSFLKYYFQTTTGNKNLLGEMTGTAIKRIVLKKIKSTPVPLPSLIEQQNIVSRIEASFEKVDNIEEKFITLKSIINNLPQTILHKALKGELVEQFLADGNAKNLLEEIRKLKIKK